MKKYFWIYFFQVFADQETDCRAAYINNNTPNTPNPPGLGLYTQDGKPKIRKEKYKGLQNEIAEAKALGKPKSDNKGAWENMGRIEAINQITSKIEGWGSACSPDKNLLSGRYNFLCTLQFIDVQMYTDGIFSSNSYFSPLREIPRRKKRGKISDKEQFRNRIKLFHPCSL